MLAEYADEVTERQPAELAEQLASRFADCPVATQGLLLTALLKLRMAALDDAALRTRTEALFRSCVRHQDVELSQRAAEYLKLSEMGEVSVVVRETVLAPMPDWPGHELLVQARTQLGADVTALRLHILLNVYMNEGLSQTELLKILDMTSVTALSRNLADLSLLTSSKRKKTRHGFSREPLTPADN